MLIFFIKYYTKDDREIIKLIGIYDTINLLIANKESIITEIKKDSENFYENLPLIYITGIYKNVARNYEITEVMSEQYRIALGDYADAEEINSVEWDLLFSDIPMEFNL